MHRERVRVEMGEAYRTMLGHLRHEIGHYYEMVLVDDEETAEEARALFGDERADYQAALDRHYADGPPDSWAESYVSAYATMHPFEDFAETFAHVLHVRDGLETAHAFGLIVDPAVAVRSFADVVIGTWLPLTRALNQMNRSMGQSDLYPFVVSPPVVDKLDFVHGLVAGAQGTPGDPHGRRDPLRRAAARGRLAARDRRGRRPRHLRLQVPRRRPGRPGAGRRGDRRRARPAARASRTPELVVVDLDGRDRHVRGRRGGAGPAHREHRSQPRRRLPARLVRVRRRLHPRPRGGGPDPVAGCAHRQRGPVVAQPQPAASGTATCGPSTTAPASTSTTAGPAESGRPRGSPRSPTTPPTTCSPPSSAASPRSTPASPRWSRASCLIDVVALVPDVWLEPVPGAATPAALRAAYVDFLLARVSGDRSWLPVAGAA